MINGNIDGIRNVVLDKLEEIYNIKVNKDTIADERILQDMAEFTRNTGREISIAIDRKGNIVDISIGDSGTAQIPIIDIKEKKLSGIRIIHTHPSGNSRLSAVDISALIKLKLDCIVAIGVNENQELENKFTIGFCNVENNVISPAIIGSITEDEILKYDILDRIGYIETLLRDNNVEEDHGERAILVGVDNDESLEELEELAKACNVKVIERVLQRRSKLDSAFYIGKGKVEEIALMIQSLRANVVIFDDELTSSQIRNLEESIGVKVIDRTTLILDIFATRARSKEAKIQVELAQLKYRIARLMGLGTVLSRTGGGIGTRGPGEKKLETDRRHIKERIYDLRDELEKVKKTRETQRDKRGDIPKVSLVGYTNAGKSTLRNKICEIAMPKDAIAKEKVFEADMLFATLDITTRAINLPDNRIATITDTVGFVRKLPHDLVEAFKSTLEEVVYSDLLVHVVDVSADNALEQIEAVENVLNQLGALGKPSILALNKIDKATQDKIAKVKESYANHQIIEISAKQGENLQELLKEIGTMLPYKLRKVKYIIPYSDQSMVAFLHRNASIESEEFQEEGTYIVAQVDDEVYNKCEVYVVK